MARSTTAGRIATLGAVFGLFVSACATNLPAPSGPSASPPAAASPSTTPSPTLTATPASSPSPTDDGSGEEPTPEPTPQPTPVPVPTGTAGIDWQGTVVSATLSDIVETSTGALLAVGSNPRGGVLWTSNDSIDWTVVSDSEIFDRVRLTDVAVGDGAPVAIGCDVRDGRCAGGGVWIGTASRGWRRVPTGSTFAHATLADVAIHSHTAVIVGSVGDTPAIWRSDDGLTWTRVNGVPASGRTALDAVISSSYGFVASGTNAAKPTVWTSTDGTTWASTALDREDGELFEATMRGNDVVVAGQIYKHGKDSEGNEYEDWVGVSWSSADGTSWAAMDWPEGTGAIGNLAYNGDTFVALQLDSTCGSFGTSAAPTVDCIDQGDGTLSDVDQAIAYKQGFLLVGPHGIWTSPKVAVHEPLDPNTVIPAYGWTSFPLMPSLGRFTAAGVGDHVFVFSELGGNGALRVDDVDSTGKFKRLPTIPAGMLHPHAVVNASESRIYLVGLDSSGTRGRFGEYDVKRRGWRLLPALPTGRDDPAVTLGPDGRVYVLGGRRVPCCTVAQGGGAVATVERYDPKTNRWTRLAPMPFASASVGAAAGEGKLFLFLPERVWTYDRARDRWTAGPTSLTYGATGSPTQGQDGLIRVFACDHYDIWDPVDGHWQPGRAFTSPRCGAVAAAQGAQIVLFGGEYTGNEGRSLESIDSGGG